jgi:acetyltransferase-like isoleucine patch superfamily enzyme
MSEDFFRAQHKLRLSWMPWLFFTLKDKHKAWALLWQKQVQDHFAAMETITFGQNCFVAPEAKLFAEPGRPITVGSGSSIAAEAFVHGPVELGENVSLNARVVLDGGSKGIRIGAGSRIASGVAIYAFDHGMLPEMPVRCQAVKSRGIVIGKDVWIGANAGITDGVTIGDHAWVWAQWSPKTCHRGPSWEAYLHGC